MKEYDHYISCDWSSSNMAIARMTKKVNKIKIIDVPADIKELKLYLKELKGTKILTFEESTASQWLYVELNSYVDKILVCDPYRNHLLSEGPKTDKIDAVKMLKLLKSDLLKEVYHTGDEIIYLRKIVSGYEDIVKAGVSIKNQRSALFRAVHKNPKEDALESVAEKFVLEGLNKGIENYEKEKLRYEDLFKKLSKKYIIAKRLKDLPGIRDIHAMKILSRVVTPKRFKNLGHFLSYCGLIKLKRISGGVVYGKKNSRYCRMLKCVFNMATSSAIRDGANNPLNNYYMYLLNEKKYSERNAKQATKRRLATFCFGIMKTGKKFEPYMWRKNNVNAKQQ